jgi:type IX secretion system PorP/SprF family membrane protein
MITEQLPFMKKLFLVIFLFFFVVVANAQQDPQFSQYMFNELYSNPGYAGSNNAICATALNRTQWSGFEGAPNTTSFSVEAPVALLHGGLGINILTDAIAQNQFTGFNLSYAYRTELAQGSLGIGASIGMLQNGIDNSFITEQVGDPSIPNGEKAAGLDLGFGLYYNNDKMYVGLSSRHLNESSLVDVAGVIDLKRHYYLTAGYSHELASNLELKPSILIKSEGITTTLDLSSLVEYNKKMWGGVTYRPSYGAVLLFGTRINKDLKFGLSYDLPTSKVSGVGSIEFMLGYCFKLDYNKVAKGFKNPRFL